MSQLCLVEAPLPTVGIGPAVVTKNSEMPNAGWSSERLLGYAKDQDDICVSLGRKMAVHRWRQGHALTLAKKKTPPGAWKFFLDEYGISHSTDARVRKLYENVQSEDELSGWTIKEAYVKYGIEKPRRQKAEARHVVDVTSDLPSGQKAEWTETLEVTDQEVLSRLLLANLNLIEVNSTKPSFYEFLVSTLQQFEEHGDETRMPQDERVVEIAQRLIDKLSQVKSVSL